MTTTLFAIAAMNSPFECRKNIENVSAAGKLGKELAAGHTDKRGQPYLRPFVRTISETCSS